MTSLFLKSEIVNKQSSPPEYTNLSLKESKYWNE